MRKLVLASLMAGLMAACTTTDSSIIDTDGLYAEFTLEAAGNGSTEVNAVLHVDSLTSLNYADVGNGDELRCTMSAAGGAVTSTKTMTGGAFGYSTSFDNEAGNTDFTIEFDRSGSDKESALSSTASLPDAFTLDAIPSTLARDQELRVGWSNTGTDPMTYSVTGPCIEPEQGSIARTDMDLSWDPAGAPANPLRDAAGNPNQTCTVTVTITRNRVGTVDSAFGGGVYTATQVRERTFTSTPAP